VLHENQSWLATLAVLLDTCALIQCAGAAEEIEQARTTYAASLAVVTSIAHSFEGELAIAPAQANDESIATRYISMTIDELFRQSASIRCR
jgi:hypothetical protein